MVEDLSYFNAIMRHTWLHDMKVIPSMYHRMVSYLTEDEEIDIFGSQLVTHQCYQVAHESRSTSGSELCTKPTNAEEQ